MIGCSRLPLFPLFTLRASRPGITLRSLNSLDTLLPLRAGIALRPLDALDTLRSLFPLWPADILELFRREIIEGERVPPNLERGRQRTARDLELDCPSGHHQERCSE